MTLLYVENNGFYYRFCGYSATIVMDGTADILSTLIRLPQGAIIVQNFFLSSPTWVTSEKISLLKI
jgi:hypothetical protein